MTRWLKDAYVRAAEEPPVASPPAPDVDFRVNELIEFVAGKLPSGATISGMSWNGFNVYGDKRSMKEFRRWMTEVDRSEGLSRIIVAERKAATAHAAASEARVRELEQERDDERVRHQRWADEVHAEIDPLLAEANRLREALEKGRSIVSRNLGHQTEKLADLLPIFDAALPRPADEPGPKEK